MTTFYDLVPAAAKGRFDVAYGPGVDELLDIYLADNGDAPILNSNVQVCGSFRRNHLATTDNHVQHSIPRF